MRRRKESDTIKELRKRLGGGDETLKQLEGRLNGKDRKGINSEITEHRVREIFLEMINNNPCPQRVQSGYLRSGNFVTGQFGWSLEADGSAEFQDLTIGRRLISVAPGESIQTAIDNAYDSGGGMVLLLSGTHTLTSDITLKSGVYIEGVSISSSILDFNNGAYGIVASGTNNYITGTVSITNGTTTITGVSTVFTSAMVGRYILLGGIWYPIASYTSGTEIDIGIPYAGEDLSGVGCVISTPITDIILSRFTILNSTSNALEITYASEIEAKYITIQTSTCGLYTNYLSNFTNNNFDIIYCGTGIDYNNSHFGVTSESGVLLSTGNGVEFTNCENNVYEKNFVLSCVGDGINATGLKDSVLIGSPSKFNGESGIEFVSGCEGVFVSQCGFIGNVGDGIKLTATDDEISISSSLVKDNGAYGINIAAATCDNNLLHGNIVSGNTTAEHTDSGTGTKIRDNIGITDN